MTITGTRQFGDAGWSYHPALEAALDMLAGGLRDQMARRLPDAPREVHRNEMHSRYPSVGHLLIHRDATLVGRRSESDLCDGCSLAQDAENP